MTADADPLGRVHRLGHQRSHDELRPEQTEQVPGLSQGQREVRHDRDREERLGGGEEQLLALGRADREAVQRGARDREHDRQRADQQRPLVHLRGDEGPRGRRSCSDARRRARRRGAPAPPRRVVRATGRGGTGSMPSSMPGVLERGANGSAKSRITDAGCEEQSDHRGASGVDRERSEVSRRADEVRFLGRGSRDAPRVARRTGTRGSPLSISVIELFSGKRQRVERRHPQESELDRVVPGERDPFPTAAGRQSALVFRSRYHAMKTTIDQPMPISSRLAPVMLASARSHGDSSGRVPRRRRARSGRAGRRCRPGP